LGSVLKIGLKIVFCFVACWCRYVPILCFVFGKNSCQCQA